MANIAITKYQSANGGDWVEIKLEWSYTNTSTQATISAALYVRRDGYGPTEGNDQYWISLNNTKFVDSNGYHTIGTSFVKVCEGTKTINLTSSGASATSLTLDGYYNNNSSSTKLHALRVNKANYSGGHWTTSYGTQGSPLTGTIPAQASACTAPTSVTVVTTASTPANYWMRPTDSIKVSWSGAKSGTNKPISGYRIFLRNDSAPTTSTTTYIDVGSNVSNHTFTSSNSTLAFTRGKKIYAGVVALCSDSAYSSGIKTSGTPVYVNDLPAKPTLDKSSQTISSTSTGVKVTATAGSDSFYVSAPVVHYATSPTGTKSPYSSAITINPSIGGTSTYYFWTYDGLEYSSSSTSITITKNTKPKISWSSDSNCTNIDVTKYIARGVNTDVVNAYVYQINKFKIHSNKSSGTYEVRYRYSFSGENYPSEWEYMYKDVSFSAANFTITANFNLESIFKTKIGSGLGNTAMRFQFCIKIKDDYEYSDWWYFSTLTEDSTTVSGTPKYKTGLFADIQSFWYSGAPTYRGTKPSIVGPNTDYTFTLNNDARMTNWSISAKYNNTSVTLSVDTITKDDNDLRVNIPIKITSILPDNENDDINITFTVTASRASPAISKSLNFDIPLRMKSQITSVTFENNPISVFPDSQGALQSGTLKISGIIRNDFNINNLTAKIFAYKENIEIDTEKTISNISATFENLFATIAIDDFFDCNTKTLGISKRNWYGNTQTYNFRVKIVNQNIYGEEVSANSNEYRLDFDHNPSLNYSTPFSVSDIIKYKNGQEENFTFLGNHYLQQNQFLSFYYSIKNYCYRNIVIKIEASKNNEGLNPFYTYSEAIEIGTDKVATNNTTPAIVTGTFPSNNYLQLEEIDVTNIYWKITITQNNISSDTGWLSSDALKLIFPIDFKINSITRDLTENNNRYIVKYQYRDLGIILSSAVPKVTGIIQLQYDNNGQWIDFEDPDNIEDGPNMEHTFNVPGTLINSTKSFRLKLTTAASTSEGYIKNERIIYSQEVLVYTDEPTIAYRKNYIGINNKATNQNAVVYINTAEQHENIVLEKIGVSKLIIFFPKDSLGNSIDGVISLDVSD